MTIEDIALQMTPGIGVKGAVHLLGIFGDARGIFAAAPEELAMKAALREDIIRNIVHRKGFAAAEKELGYCRRNSISAIASTDPEFPALLREIPDYPHVLYLKGNAAALSARCVAMVGTRRQWEAFYDSERPILADLIVSGTVDEIIGLYGGKNLRRSQVIAGAYEAEDFFPRVGGNGRWLYFTAAPLRNALGEIIGAIETLQDVTDRHLAEERLLAHQNQLEQMVSERTSQLAKANTELEVERKALEELLARVEEAQQQLLQSEKMAAIGQLAAGVAHEINNPVGFVNSNLGALKTYCDDLLGLLRTYERFEAQLTAEDEELTPTMKLKRKLVQQKYAAQIDAMYQA
jgi:signal transduction histidine kinase